MSRITGNWVGFDIPTEKPYQRVYRDAELDIKRKHTGLDSYPFEEVGQPTRDQKVKAFLVEHQIPSPFREETEFGDPRENKAFNESIRYTKQVSDDGGQTWSEPQPCEVLPRVIESSKTKLPIREADEYDIDALIDIRTDQLWELIFEKYRLLDAPMIARRCLEISDLLNRMANWRQTRQSPIPNSVLESFKIDANRPRRPIRDNPQA